MIILWPCLSKGQSAQILKIGSDMPDITLSPILNYSPSKISFSKLGNKLVLFDFMTTGCASCIAALPRFDSLQKAFNHQLQIFLVIPQPKEKVNAFLKRPNIKNLHLAAISEDTILSQLFPHYYISHDVLIKNGKVISITYPEYINVKNIKDILDGKNINLPVKRDITRFQYNKPLLHLNENIIPDFSYPVSTAYNAVTSYMDNVPFRYTKVRDTSKNIVRISMINIPILDLYMRIFGEKLAPAFILLKVSDSNRYEYRETEDNYHEWLTKNTYCYEGSFPMNFSDSDIKKKIISDLDFYLGLQGKMIKRNIACWVICKSSDEPPFQKKYVPKNFDPSNNASVNDILFFMNKNFNSIPVIDETGNGELKIQGLQWSECTNIPFLKKKLKEYGLEINLMNRSVDMLQIKENIENNL
jgi:thiol-disulfide isomerase/thioredoxin